MLATKAWLANWAGIADNNKTISLALTFASSTQIVQHAQFVLAQVVFIQKAPHYSPRSLNCAVSEMFVCPFTIRLNTVA